MGKVFARLLPAGVSAVVASLVAACAPTSTYLTNSSQGTYLKIPHSWRAYSQASLKHDGILTNTLPYLVAFDSAPMPDPKHLLHPTTYPWGLAEVEDISSSDQLTFSFDSLLNTVIPVDQISSTSGGSVTPLSPPRVITRGDLRGVEADLQVKLTGLGPLAYEQVSLVNSVTTKAWVLFVGCSPQCFAKNHSAVNRVVNSWIVRDKEP